ncbi:hypothetical protein HWV62_39525 [Athelia sp. TMB]|nr:hypothetical protein HWV62_39525 [Athelia sp. TMB]
MPSTPEAIPASLVMDAPHQLGPNLFTGFPEYSPEWLAPNGRPYTHTIDIIASDYAPSDFTCFDGGENFLRMFTFPNLKSRETCLSHDQISAAKCLLMLAPQPDPYADSSVPCVFVRGAPADVMSFAVLYLVMSS